MATAPGVLPTSNVGGNNQTSPGGMLAGGASSAPVFTPVQGVGTVPSANPMLSAAPTSTPATGAGLYNTASSYSSGQTDISKQLVDIFGKGIGGSENKLLSSLSGVDSQVFQQWLASQVPAQAQAEAAMHQSLGSMGVGGNSSVMGLAEANLGANFNAQAAAENASLMQQNIGTTQNILQNAQGAAAQEVATSPWSIASQVIGEVGNVAGTFMGAGGIGGALGGLFKGGGGAMSNFASPVLGGGTSDLANINPSSFMGQLGQSGPDLSSFAAQSPSVSLPWA